MLLSPSYARDGDETVRIGNRRTPERVVAHVVKRLPPPRPVRRARQCGLPREMRLDGGDAQVDPTLGGQAGLGDQEGGDGRVLDPREHRGGVFLDLGLDRKSVVDIVTAPTISSRKPCSKPSATATALLRRPT